VTLVAAGPGHWRACAVRHTVHRPGGAASRIEVSGPVTALALDPGGARLAIGHEDGVTLWAGGDAPRVLPARGSHGGLCWSHDRNFLASFTPEGILRVWRLAEAAPFEIAAAASTTALGSLAAVGFVAGVGGRVICWNPRDGAIRNCGVANQSPVTRVAGHPHRPLVAAGYANGTVVLCQPDSTGLLFLRSPGDGAVSALAFSPFGGCLAIGTDGGDIGVLALPDTLFRDRAGQQ
jgi:WD40 repeat protein